MSTGRWIIRALRRLGIARVSFPDGSSVEFADREGLCYSESDGHSVGINFYFKYRFRKGRRLVLREIQHWDPPNEAEPISDAKRQEIRDKIVIYCTRRGIPLVVQ